MLRTLVPVIGLFFSLLAASTRPGRAAGFEELFARLPAAGGADSTPSGLNEMPASRIAKMIEADSKHNRQGSDERVLSPTCVVAPTFSDFFELKDLEPEAGERNRLPVPDGMSLDQPAHTLIDVFTIIKTTEVGSAILKKFLPKFGFDIKVENFNERQFAARSHSTLTVARPTEPLAAMYDSAKRTIYIDKREQLGQLAFVLLHEIVHSLDGDFVKSLDTEQRLGRKYSDEVSRVIEQTAQRTGKPVTALERFDIAPADFTRMVSMRRELQEFRDLRIFRAERFAYDASYRVWLELDRRFPGYYQKGMRGRSGKPVPYDDAWLVKILRLNADTISRYQRGLCRTPSAA